MCGLLTMMENRGNRVFSHTKLEKGSSHIYDMYQRQGRWDWVDTRPKASLPKQRAAPVKQKPVWTPRMRGIHRHTEEMYNNWKGDWAAVPKGEHSTGFGDPIAVTSSPGRAGKEDPDEALYDSWRGGWSP